MRTLAFDGRMGASGDMILAALVAAGANPGALAPVEEELPVRYAIDQTVKNGVDATTVDVYLDTETTREAEQQSDSDDERDSAGHISDHEREQATGSEHHSTADHSHTDGHSHDHTADHSHNHVETPSKPGETSNHEHAEGSGITRSYEEVIEIVGEMSLSKAIEQQATSIFERLGRAEAAVHATDLEETHFHEVGTDDAIADVVGAVLLLAELDVGRIVTTPLATGGGEVTMSHGTYPVPTPAVVELAEGANWAMCGGPVEAELLTPTGAAILAELADGVTQLPTVDVNTSGYGAGGYSFDEYPNVLRAIVGGSQAGLRRDEITVLETNVDDATPETLGRLHDTLAEVGARDVSVLPMTMKKSRPGHLIKVICDPADAKRVARRLATETGSLGVRESGVTHRFVADRSFETVRLELGEEHFEIPVKIARTSDGAPFDISAEYDEAASVADKTGVPVREVARQAEASAESELNF